MTKYEVVTNYLERQGYKVIKGKVEENVEPFIPWLLMDIELSTFSTYIGTNWRFDLKKHAKAWMEAYNDFNQRGFFKWFTEEEQEEVIGYMNEFEEFVKEDVENLMREFSGRIRTGTERDKEVVAAVETCFTLAVNARTMHRKVYKWCPPMTKWCYENMYFQEYKEKQTPELDAIINLAEKFGNAYAKQRNLGRITRTDRITELTDVLCRKAVKWLFM